MKPSFFRISEMAATYSVSYRTLRFYEQQGFLRPRRHGTQRLYTASDAARLQLIIKGKRLGFTLGELKKLIAQMNARSGEITPSSASIFGIDQDHIAKRIEALSRKRAETQHAIDHLKAALAR